MVKFLGVMVVLAILCTGAVHADSLAGSFSLSGIAAVNDGTVFGAAISYQAMDHLWADLGVRKNYGTSAGFVGISTDLKFIGRAALSVFDIDVNDFSTAYRIGVGKTLSFDDDGIFAYLSYDVGF